MPNMRCLLVLSAVLFVCMRASQVRAGTITVGPGCSLSDAILAANGDILVGACAAGSGADRIELPPGTITFTAVYSLFIDPDSALPHVTSDIDFVGAGKTSTIIARDPIAPDFRFLTIDDGVAVSLQGLGFTGGRIPNYGGGAVYHVGTSPGSALTITDCAFTGNTAGYGGAGAVNSNAALIVTGSNFDANSGTSAGALYAGGASATLQASTFTHNGGSHIAYLPVRGDILVDDCTFADNDAVGAYALLMTSSVGGSMVVRDSQFLRHRGDTALVFQSGALPGAENAIEGCVFEGNGVAEGSTGGALYVYAIAAQRRLDIVGCTFARNRSIYAGAGLVASTFGETDAILVSHCTFEDNVASYGGGLQAAGHGTTFIEDSTFSRNVALNPSGAGGGAIYESSYMEVRRSRFDANRAYLYASLTHLGDASESGTVGQSRVVLEGYGGAILSGRPYLAVDNCFVGNDATALFGRADARGNWWGAADGAGLRGGGGGSGDTAAADVTTVPFLTAPPVACAAMARSLPPVQVEVTIGGSATPGDDYDPIVTPLQIDPASGGHTIAVVAVNDDLVEGPENVFVALPAGEGYQSSGGTDFVGILDDGTGCGHSCDDHIDCTTDRCDSHTLNCTHTPVAAACDDGKPCTIDSCNAASGCAHVASQAACDDHNPCTSDTCEAAGTCSHGNLTGACADSDPCTIDTICTNGVCGGGSAIPGCETKVVDLGEPFGEVVLPVPTGDLCFGGTKAINGCAPLGTCEITVNACFYPNDTIVDVVVDTGLGVLGNLQFVGRWLASGWCVTSELPNVQEGPVTLGPGSVVACWDGAGGGFIAAHASASSVEHGINGTQVDGTLKASVQGDGTVRVSGCLDGETTSTTMFTGLPGTFSSDARLSVCIGAGAKVHLKEWRPFVDDPSQLLTDVEATFVFDALHQWALRIDRVLDPLISFCRFILKAGELIGEKVDKKWLVTLRGVASFDFAEQHVETSITGVLKNTGITLTLSSSADFSLFLKYGDPEEDGVLVQARKKLKKQQVVNLGAPVLPMLRLVCTPPSTTVDIDGSVSFGLCEQSLAATVSVHGELGQPGFRLEGSATMIGAFGFPTPLLLPGLVPIPGPLCLGMAEGGFAGTVCGGPPREGLWLHTRAQVPLLSGQAADVELRIGLAPPKTGEAYASLGAPVDVISPAMNVPGIARLTIGESEVALHMDACSVADSGLSFTTDASLVTTDGDTIAASASVALSPTQVKAAITTKGRWTEPFGIPDHALEQGSVLALVFTPGAEQVKLGFRGLAYLKTGGAWPATVAAETPGAEICDDLPTADEDKDGKANCDDADCANHLLCRAARIDGGVVALRTAIYVDTERAPGPGGFVVPTFAVRFDLGAPEGLGPRVVLPQLPAIPAIPARAAQQIVLAVLDSVALVTKVGVAIAVVVLQNQVSLVVPIVGIVAVAVVLARTVLLDKLDTTAEYTQDQLLRLQTTMERLNERLFGLQHELLDGYRAHMQSYYGLGGQGLPKLCDAIDCGVGGVSIAPAKLGVRALSISFATRDAVFDDLSFAAGVHAIATSADERGQVRLEGSFGEGGVILAGSVNGTPGTLGLILGTAAVMPILKVKLTGDPYNRLASWPGDGAGFVRVGAMGAGALELAREGTVEGTVSRGTWETDPFSASLASRFGSVGPVDERSGRGWRIGLGDGQGTGWARITFQTYDATGIVTRAQTTMPVVAPGQATHIAVTWKAVTPAGGGQEVLDVAIFANGIRQPTYISDGSGFAEDAVRVPGSTDAALIAGIDLGTLDELRVWNVARPAIRIDGEQALLPPLSAADPSLLVRYDFDRDLGSRATNRGAGGAALDGVFVAGVGTVRAVGDPVIVARVTAGPAIGDSVGLSTLAGFDVTTPVGTTPFRVEARANAGTLAASITAVEAPLWPLDRLGTLCAVDLSLAADAATPDATGNATLALCRASDQGGNVTLGDVEVAITCHGDCPDPAIGLVVTATGTVGPIDIAPDGAPSLRMSGQFTGSTARREVTVDGRLETDAWSLDGQITLSDRALAVETTVDLPPILGVDLGPTELHLTYDHGAQRFCGTGSGALVSGSPCNVEICLEQDGDVTGAVNCGGAGEGCLSSDACAATEACLAGKCVPRLPDGSPCAFPGMCQSGYCSQVCYTPGQVGPNGECLTTIADQCSNALVCVAQVCRNALLACPSTCLPLMPVGGLCVGDAQCPADTECRRPTPFLPKRCAWPSGSLEVGRGCSGNDECASRFCFDGLCRCGGDGDCGGGETCVLGACVAPSRPDHTLLPGQPCADDSECTLGQCVSGTCGCKTSPDCASSSYYCANPSGGALPTGICVHKLPDGAFCLSGDMCSHESCGGILRPPTCFGARSASLGQECVANGECATGACQLECSWGGDCSPLAAIESFTSSGQPPAGCTCTTKCACSSDANCGSGRYCGGLTYAGADLPGLRICLDKLGRGSACSSNGQCSNGTCRSVTVPCGIGCEITEGLCN